MIDHLLVLKGEVAFLENWTIKFIYSPTQVWRDLPLISTACASLQHTLRSKNAPFIVNENIFTAGTGYGLGKIELFLILPDAGASLQSIYTNHITLTGYRTSTASFFLKELKDMFLQAPLGFEPDVERMQ